MSETEIPTGDYGRMTGEQFKAWIAEMKEHGRAKNKMECAALLGISQNSIANLLAKGADTRTALACRALLLTLPPYD